MKYDRNLLPPLPEKPDYSKSAQLKSLKIYKIFCEECHEYMYSKENECRYDFIERLSSEGWRIGQNYMNIKILCPKCKAIKESQRKNRELKRFIKQNQNL